MKSIIKTLSIVMFVASIVNVNLNACTRLTYKASDDTVVTGRSMDWATKDTTTIRVHARGEKRTSVTTTNPLSWTSKYGSVVVYSNELLANSGVNEKNLEVDLLWLGCSDYGKVQNDDKTLNNFQFGLFILDNFATTDEAVQYLKSNPIRLVAQQSKEEDIKLHFVITDKDGKNAIIEYINGEPKIYEVQGNMVLTNDPEYDKMLAIENYFEQAGIEKNMPGSCLSEARFVCASSWLKQLDTNISKNYIDGITDKKFENQATMSVLSVVRAISTPLALANINDPNNSSTLWRTVSDLKNGRLYFDSALAPTIVWVDINKVNYKKSAKLDLSAGKIMHGNITKLLNK